MAYIINMWAIEDVEFDFITDSTDGPVLAVNVTTPSGSIQIISEPVEQGRSLVLSRTSIQSLDLGPNQLGHRALRWIAYAVMERMDYDEIIIEGSPRNTGAGPGRTPKPIRFARRPRTAP